MVAAAIDRLWRDHDLNARPLLREMLAGPSGSHRARTSPTQLAAQLRAKSTLESIGSVLRSVVTTDNDICGDFRHGGVGCAAAQGEGSAHLASMTMVDPQRVLQRGDALIVVDVQRDFCPGGALPVDRGDEVVPALNRWLAAAANADVPVYASRDWHPTQHVSFTTSGGPWPPHCVQDSEGARFHADLRLPHSTTIVTKGARLDRDQYSAFDDTGLASELRARGVTRVWVGGLAQDVCVQATVLDARREGFAATVIADGTRPMTRAGGDEAHENMRRAGVRFETTG